MKNYNENIKVWKPTSVQEILVDALIEGKTISGAAHKAGIGSRSTVYLWLRKKEFLEYLCKQRASRRIGTLPAVDKAVQKQAINGNIIAARLMYELAGEIGKNKLEEKEIRIIWSDKMDAVRDPEPATNEAEQDEINEIHPRPGM